MAWAERLGTARATQLVGRDAELERLDGLPRDPKKRLAYVFGPPGAGKTLLVREWIRRVGKDARVAVIDAQVDVWRPAAIEELVRGATIIAVDDLHRLEPLEGWFYDVFLPARGDDVRVVVTSRRAPRQQELLDPAWRELMDVIELAPLPVEASRAYLEGRGVAEEARASILSFAHGIPLWLCIGADLALAHPERRFDAASTTELLEPVVRELLDDAPTHLHRRALHATAIAVVMLESLLAAALEVPDSEAAEIFRWLCDRPYVQRAGAEGVRLHDALRAAMRADLQWRDSSAMSGMVDRIYAATLRSIWAVRGAEQERRVVRLTKMLAHEPGGIVLGGAGGEEHYSDVVADEEIPEILAAVERWEGKAAARAAEAWVAHERDGLVAIRDADRRISAFLLYVEVDASTPARVRDADPFVGTLLSHLAANAPLRPGEKALVTRWWLSIDDYQRPVPMQLRMFSHIGWRLAFVGESVVGAVHADPDDWMNRPERPHDLFGRFDLGGKPYGIFGTDWRRSSRERWVERLVATFRHLPVGPPGPKIEYDVLGRDAFGRAVRAALRTITRRDRLVDSPLVATRLVGERSPEALAALLASGVEALAAQPGTKRHALVLQRTYFSEQAVKGLAVADDLGLPYGSYRRILNEGVELLVEELWRRECAGS